MIKHRNTVKCFMLINVLLMSVLTGINKPVNATELSDVQRNSISMLNSGNICVENQPPFFGTGISIYIR
jgi:hypothetical protein